MFENYFKIAWRNLFRNKGFSVTNLLGLTIGMTCTILILLWVQDEVTYDQFHANYKNIYQVIANRNFNNQVLTDRNMVFPLASSLEKGYPQIKNAVVTTYSEDHVLAYGEAKLKKQGYTVGGNFFGMFSWKFVKGNPATAISDPSSIVLTVSAAKSLFGNEDPIGKIVQLDAERDFKVSAILADPPPNSSFRFDFVRAFNYSNPSVQRAMQEWRNSSWNVFLQLEPGTKTEVADRIINNAIKQHDPNESVSTYFTFPMSKWHLYADFKDGRNAGGMIDYVRLFTIIAIIILLIACINFMNLSTARSEKRAKEVGVRKTLGSGKKQLVLQFFFESMILALIAFAFSVFAVLLVLPAFNRMVDKELTLQLGSTLFWITSLIIVLFTGVVAGSYPALYLSSFNPARVIKGAIYTGKTAIIPRRILVVAQFIISILLISATIIVYSQIAHVKKRHLGYNPNNLVMINSTPATDKSFAAIKQALLSTGFVSAVTRTMAPVTEVWWKTPAPDWEGKPADANIIFSGLTADVDFSKTLGIKMLEGRDFSGGPADSSSMLLNKAAAEAMNLKNPVGAKLRYGNSEFTVIGIADNVIMESPYKPVDPMMILYQPDHSGMINIRLKAGSDTRKALDAMNAIFTKFNPAFPFEYKFVDEAFSRKFLTEELISKITNIFAGLAIFICCIGLAGLASFTIEKRIREIGIRKVLGASVQQLLLLISREFLLLVVIAFIIAVPLTWWLMHNWLQNYEYRVNISLWTFGAVGAFILLLTLIVVSLNTMRAATSNPVKSLRTE